MIFIHLVETDSSFHLLCEKWNVSYEQTTSSASLNIIYLNKNELFTLNYSRLIIFEWNPKSTDFTCKFVSNQNILLERF